MSEFNNQMTLLGEREPDLDDRQRLLLWLIRNALGQEELESYEYVLDRPYLLGEAPLDAAYLSEAEAADGDSASLHLIGLSAADNLASILEWHSAAVSHLRTDTDGYADSHSLAEVARALGLTVPRKLDSSRIRVVTHVAAPNLEGPFRSDVDDLNIYGALRLESLAHAISSPSAVVGKLEVVAGSDEVMVTNVSSGPVYVCPVSCEDIAAWPGIEDRSLFDLNVRLKLGGRRVRDSLDQALRDGKTVGDFLAFHNGLTVVCDHVERSETGISVENFSVVNGAQSVIAFFENRAALNSSARVIVKFAAVGTQSNAAREIAIRSNTQNPVTTRNLRALDPLQLNLRSQFDEKTGYAFEVRPDSPRRTGSTVIRNDDAAQWLCAVYNERPWLAVKRLALFEQPAYGQIFNPRVSAEQVLFAHAISEGVSQAKMAFPAAYHRAWKLTSLVAMYLAGQVFRASDSGRALLLRGGQPPRDLLEAAVSTAAQVLSERSINLKERGLADDFKVDFKREEALRSLGARARQLGVTVL